MAKKTKTKTYSVVIPIAGEMQCKVTVSADATPDDIFEAATKLHGSNPDECDVSWEFHDKIAEDHVLHASTDTWSFTEE